MNQINLINQKYKGANNRQSLYDFSRPNNNLKVPVIIFSHGFKGYKDWGAWSKMQDFFVDRGFAFLKFNFTHNGGTINNPIDFPDLEAFSKNCYSYEVEDLNQIIHITESELASKYNLDLERIFLIGHSRGGGITTLVGSLNTSIKSFVTWAGVADFKERFPVGEELLKWKEKGISYIHNARTKQEMPLLYSFHEDFIQNELALDISSTIKNNPKKALLISGEEDLVVSSQSIEELTKVSDLLKFIEVKGANHTFNTKHPFSEEKLSEAAIFLLDSTLEFLKEF